MATAVTFETGDNLNETNFSEMAFSILCDSSFIISGGAVSDSGGVTIDVSAGVAMVNGYRIAFDAVTGQTVANNNTNYVWVESDGTITDNTTGSAPSTNAVPLGIVVTSGGSISSITHRADTSHAAASQLTQGLNVLRYKDADESTSSDTTLSADSDLTFTANPREIWELTAHLIIDQDNATPNFQCRFSLPSGGITDMGIGPDDDLYSAATTASGEAGTATYNHTSGVNGTTIQILHAVQTNGIVFMRAVAWIGETGGTLSVDWSQITSSANNTTVKTGSTLLARRILG